MFDIITPKKLCDNNHIEGTRSNLNLVILNFKLAIKERLLTRIKGNIIMNSHHE
jgi:hypothetical protein